MVPSERSANPAGVAGGGPTPERDLRSVATSAGVSLAAVVASGMVLAALLPRWWARTLGNLIDGRLIFGSVAGVVVGLVCTYVPLLLLWWGLRSRERRVMAIAMVVLAAIVALPNLMTLWIAVGSGSSAHAGERILDVDGPGFRGGSVIGVLLGLAGMAFVLWTWRTKRRGAGRRTSA